ncbi:ATP dependent DNA helicase [Gigaspora margarita]|uniref:ATP dependent DNA helicase n=1 Tax=Gigaspora margarita TaxID=4874 RepID=A0A8H4B2R2_GIGMA|nr:ATP dependent DNA helicase [Gigaspora margarita]
MEHANLIGSITKITPILIEYDIVLGVAIDGDLNSNKTLADQPISNIQSNALKEFFKGITQLAPHQSLITKIRTSQNESVNRIKLNYMDKKQDYPKSYKTHHALAVIYNNNSLLELLQILGQAGCGSFSKRFPKQVLCKLCGFYWKNELSHFIINSKFHSIKSKSSIQPKSNLIKTALLEIFNLQHFKKLQFESIESFILNKDTLTIMPTGGGKP